MENLKALYWLMLAGVSGAIVSLSVHKEKRTPGQVILFLVSGMLTAIFVTPLLARWFGINDTDGIAALSFAIGSGWQSVAGKLIEWVTQKTTSQKAE